MLFGDEVCVDVGFDMMNRVQRFLMGEGKCSRGECPDEERANKSWCIGDGDRIDIMPGTLCVAQCFCDDRIDHFDMASCGHFGNNDSILGMDIYLRMNHITEKPRTVFDDSGRRFITTTFNSQNLHYQLVYHPRSTEALRRH